VGLVKTLYNLKRDGSSVPRADVIILKIFSPKIFAKKYAFFEQYAASFAKLDHNIGFQEKRQFFPRKMAENCDHNIDPCFLNNLKHFFSFFYCVGTDFKMSTNFVWYLSC
jgi:hypothetical protein